MNVRKIWYWREPLETKFATCWLRSSLQVKEKALCTRCGRGVIYVMPKPLVIEWEPGSDLVGEFIWPGGGRLAASRPVFELLAREFGEIVPEPVAMVQDPKLRRPARPNRRSKPRVWLPYTGTELVEVWPTRVVRVHPRTTYAALPPCPDCGYVRLGFTGFEVKSRRYDIIKDDFVTLQEPRVPGKGVFVAASDVTDAGIFRLDTSTGPIAISDRVKRFIEQKGFTNIDFCEYGDIVDE